METDDIKNDESNESSIRKKKNRKKSNVKSNDINSVLKQIPIKKEEKKIEIPSLTNICLEIIYSNIQRYDSFDFLPQDLAAELLVMVVDRQSLTRDTARPFLNTKHELIRQFCKKHIDVSRLPAICNYGCRGFD